MNINIQNSKGLSTIEIINILGEVVYATTVESATYKNLPLGTEIFNAKGIYFVKVFNSETVKAERIIIN